MPLSQSCENSRNAQQRASLLDDLACEFLEALVADFRLHKTELIGELRKNDAKAYMAIVARLSPTGSERDTGGGVMVTTTIDLGGIDG